MNGCMTTRSARLGRALGGLLAAALLVTACSGTGARVPGSPAASPASSSDRPSAADVSPATDIGKGDKAQVTGAGSTAIYPWLGAIAQSYERDVATGVSLNYQAIGSGGGVTQFTAKTVDFGASDIYLSDAQEQQIGVPVLNVPMIHWAVAVTYDLPGVSADLRFSPGTLAGIYLGQITAWDDPRVAADNPGLTLPSLGITVVHRSDGSGTTYNFSAFLAATDATWKAGPGMGTSLSWPVGVGGKGNAGVAALVKQTPGAIGYVDLAYATQNSLAVGQVENAAGSFVKPSLAATTAAIAAAAADAPADLRFLAVAPPASSPEAYPIAASTWVLLYRDYPASKLAEATALVHFLWWAIHDGQGYAAQVDYAAMAPALVAKAEAALRSVTVGGRPILP